MTGLTNAEKEAINKTAELWNAILGMKVIHPDEISELKTKIHDIQARIFARPMIRLEAKKGLKSQ